MMKNDDGCGDLTLALETARGEALRSNDVIILKLFIEKISFLFIGD